MSAFCSGASLSGKTMSNSTTMLPGPVLEGIPRFHAYLRLSGRSTSPELTVSTTKGFPSRPGPAGHPSVPTEKPQEAEESNETNEMSRQRKIEAESDRKTNALRHTYCMYRVRAYKRVLGRAVGDVRVRVRPRGYAENHNHNDRKKPMPPHPPLSPGEAHPTVPVISNLMPQSASVRVILRLW